MIKYFELLNFNGRAERLNLWRGSAGASERHGAARPAARTVPAEDAFLYTLIMAKSGLTFEQGRGEDRPYCEVTELRREGERGKGRCEVTGPWREGGQAARAVR